MIVSEEPVRSFNTGPNQVVAWVVHMAANHVARLFALQQQGSAYTELIESAMSEIAAVKRLDALREPLKHVATNRRPESGRNQGCRALAADDLSSCDCRL